MFLSIRDEVMSKTAQQYIQVIKATLIRVEILFYSLIWLMVLLFVGTISQRYIGLYEVQSLYFSSFITWFGPVPVPGGYFVLSAIFINLLAKLLFSSPWSIKRSGIIITHIGALLLLFGGFLTAVSSHEGYMAIPEGQSRDYISDYHQRELAIVNVSDNISIVVPYAELRSGADVSIGLLPFSIGVLERCRNCVLMEDQDKNIVLRTLANEKEDEVNQAGLVFRISGVEHTYVVSESMVSPIRVNVDGVTYDISMRRARSVLPFEIALVDFQKIEHPGTSTAKSYSSEVRVIDAGVEWRSVISMNEPLRYKGYTFYQSSFVSDGGVEETVLSVVRNAGRMFPYISSIVMCIGLLIHLVIRIPKLMRKV